MDWYIFTSLAYSRGWNTLQASPPDIPQFIPSWISKGPPGQAMAVPVDLIRKKSEFGFRGSSGISVIDPSPQELPETQ
jgi:hypothetical protein